MVKAAVDGHLMRSFPDLTPQFIRSSYIITDATAKAYLQRTRQNIHSSRADSRAQHSLYTPPRLQDPVQLVTALLTPKQAYDAHLVNYTDATAAFPKTNVHFLITYADAPNYVKVTCLKDFTQATFLKGYMSHIEAFELSNPAMSFTPS
jgi:hypothetical protein